MPSTPYPNAAQIEEMFSNRANTVLFNSYLAHDVDVLVVGGDDFHIGGRYNSVRSWHDGIYNHVASALKIETYKVEVLRVIGGGDSPWAAVETMSTATTKYGECICLSICCCCFLGWLSLWDEQVPSQYMLFRKTETESDVLDGICSSPDKPYTNLHVDLVRYDSHGKIAHLREFFDTRHVHDHLEEHHQKSGEGK